MRDDSALLTRYAREHSEEAFAEFVRRHLPLVYASALRRLRGDVHRAEDVAQGVFCAVARDARQLARHRALTGWLYVATRNAVIDLVRADARRRTREQETFLMSDSLLETSSAADWSQLRPVLDLTMDQLGETEREAVLLRFFQGRTYADIGETLGLSEEAARKRVDRSIDRLRELLRPHGITSTAAALTTLLSPVALSAAPASLAASVTGAALTQAGASLAPLVFMQLTKLQAGLATLLMAGGIAGLVWQQRTLGQLRTDLIQTEMQRSALTEENASLQQQRTKADTLVASLRTEIAQRETVAQPAAPIPTPNSPSKTAPVRAQATEKEKLHHRYDPFLQRYGLTPEQQERFVELKLAIAEAQADLQTAVREVNAEGGSTTVEAMRKKLTGPLWAEIRQLLGEDGYRAYGDYERTSAFRVGMVEALEPSFSAASAQLSAQQSDQLAQTVAGNVRSTRVNPTDISTRGEIDWPAVLTQSQEFLTPAQLGVLQAFVQHQRTTTTSGR